MFDVGFLELLLVGIIALIVLGPERLPKAARTLGLWVGKAKQSFNSIKTEIDRELKLQEIQQQLKAEQAKLEKQLGADELRESLQQAEQQIHQLGEQITAPLEQPSENLQQEIAASSEETKSKQSHDPIAK